MTGPRPTDAETYRTRTDPDHATGRTDWTPARRDETDRPTARDARSADSDGYFGTDIVPATIPPNVSDPATGVSRPQEPDDVG